MPFTAEMKFKMKCDKPGCCHAEQITVSAPTYQWAEDSAVSWFQECGWFRAGTTWYCPTHALEVVGVTYDNHATT